MTVAFASFSGFHGNVTLHCHWKYSLLALLQPCSGGVSLQNFAPVLLVLQSIARLSSSNSFKIFARLVKHSQTKLLAIQGSTVYMLTRSAVQRMIQWRCAVTVGVQELRQQNCRYSDGVLWLSVYRNWDSRTVGHASDQVIFPPSGSEVILKFVILLHADKMIMKTHNFSPWT